MYATPTCNSYRSKISKGTDIYSNKQASEGCSDGSYYLPYNVINAIFKYNIHSATVAMENMPV